MENSKETIQFLTPTKIWLHRFGGRVLGGKLEAVRAHGLDARQCAGVGYHVPGEGERDVLVVSEKGIEIDTLAWAGLTKTTHLQINLATS